MGQLGPSVKGRAGPGQGSQGHSFLAGRARQPEGRAVRAIAFWQVGQGSQGRSLLAGRAGQGQSMTELGQLGRKPLAAVMLTGHLLAGRHESGGGQIRSA